MEGFFYNPNIHPRKEYDARQADLAIITGHYECPVHYGEYDVREWFKTVKPFSHTPEQGERCHLCFRMRLARVLQFAQEHKFDFFTTTLSVSPHKSSVLINTIGRGIGSSMFLERDFKKKAGFQESLVRARALGIRRQDYCGCAYSLIERNRRVARM